MASSSSARGGGNRCRTPRWCVDLASRVARERLGRRMHGADDVMVARAPAQISFEAGANLLFGRMRVASEQLVRRHDHSRRAESTLQAMLLGERLLQRMEFRAG